MHRAIGFDDKAMILAVEVRDVGTDAVLAAEFQPVEAAITQALPERFLDPRRRPALFSASLEAQVTALRLGAF